MWRTAAILLCWSTAALAQPGPQFVDRIPSGAQVIDVRPSDDCLRASLPAARCLPSADLTGPDGRLANFRDILWLLGTLGLDGSEHAVVAGDTALSRDFVAGVLHLAGQARTGILTAPLTPLVQAQSRPLGGTARGLSREAVFTAPLRDHLIVLRDDLRAVITSGGVLVDGRPHFDAPLPGAIHLPHGMAEGDGAVPQGPVVAYAEGPATSLSTFTALAAQGTDAAVYIGGWRDWQAHSPAAPLPALPSPLVMVAGVLFLALVIGVLFRRKRCSF